MSAPNSRYPRLPAAVAQETVETTPFAAPDDVVKTILLDVTSELLAIQSSTNMLGEVSTDRYIPSLQVLHGRLESGYPTPFPGLTNSTEEALKRAKQATCKVTDSPPMERPLGDFEDLYYAVLAAVKAMHESIILRLNNGFNDPNALLFPNSKYTIHFFHEWLLHQWKILNEPSFVLALDNAVRTSLIEDHLYRGLLSRVEAGEVTQEEAELTRQQLYDPDVFADMPGLSWVGDEHSGMINCRLNEKYRVVFQMKKQAREKKARWAKKKDRIMKIAKSSPKRMAQEGSELYHREWQQFVADHVQRSTSAISLTMDEHLPRGGTEEGSLQEWQRPEVGKFHDGGQTVHQEGVETQPGNTQQHMLPHQQEAHIQYHEGDQGPKSHLGFYINSQYQMRTAEQGATPSMENLHRELEPYTQHHGHFQGTQLPEEMAQSVSPVPQDHALSSDAGRGMRAQRVTKYTDWLRGSASADAKRLVCRTSQTQPSSSETTLKGSGGLDTDMDVDDEGF